MGPTPKAHLCAHWGGLRRTGVQVASLHHPSLCAHTQATSCESHKARVLAGHGQGPHHPGPPWEGPPKGAHTFSKHQERARTEQNRKLHVPPLGAQESQGGGGVVLTAGGRAGCDQPPPQHPSPRHSATLHSSKPAVHKCLHPSTGKPPRAEAGPPTATGLQLSFPRGPGRGWRVT